MKERPILFSGEMVRAILNGTKSQTRRVVNGLTERDEPDNLGDGESLWNGGKVITCPYGQPGDRLWVRETLWISECGKYFARPHKSISDVDVLSVDGSCTWFSRRYEPTGFEDKDRRYTHNEFPHMVMAWSNRGKRRGVQQFESSFADVRQDIPIEPFTGNTIIKEYSARFLKQRPSIFMPRWASRITLEIVSVRVERLQEISEEDAKAEGVIPTGRRKTHGPSIPYFRGQFIDTWDSINGKKHPWDSNPWVWVLEFKRVS